MPLQSMPIAELGDELKRFIATAAKDSSSLLMKLDKLDTAVIELRQQYDDAQKRADTLEYKLNGKQSLVSSPRRSISDALMEAKTFSSIMTMGRGDKVNVELSTKDILGLGPLMPQPAGEIAGLGQIPYEVRSLIPTISTRSGAISFLRELTWTDATNVVAEGQPKPESDKTFEKVVATVETIAAYFKVSRQSYDDVAGLAAEIETNLVQGLAKKVEQQILKGTGATPQILGIYPLAPAATVVAGTPTLVDKLVSAVTELALKGYRANGIVLSPTDAGAMALLKDTTGRYLLSSLPPMPRIVTSPILAVGEWLVGDFSKARIFMREEANIQVASQNESDFTTNMLTVLGEVRLTQAVYQAAGFLKNPAAGVMAEGEQTKRR